MQLQALLIQLIVSLYFATMQSSREFVIRESQLRVPIDKPLEKSLLFLRDCKDFHDIRYTRLTTESLFHDVPFIVSAFLKDIVKIVLI